MSVWGKIGKALAIGGNIALPFLTGGLSLPAQLAIGAGAGAGTGALTGGKKGALLGGALGAIPGIGQIGKAGNSTSYIDDAIGSVAKAGGGGSKLGGVFDIFSKMKGAGLDPTSLALGGMSLMGGDPNQQMSPFKGSVAPPALLEAAMKSLNAGRPPVDAATQARRRLPEPVRIDVPGVPFQIGGGLGTDPALRASLEASATPGGIGTGPLANTDPNQMKSQRRKPGTEQV